MNSAQATISGTRIRPGIEVGTRAGMRLLDRRGADGGVLNRLGVRFNRVARMAGGRHLAPKWRQAMRVRRDSVICVDEASC
ncbi:hypothetical protein GCM10008174_08150 [Methylopila turkensis]|uniref:Uncharacterized protein n=1 Tax=Methylopila turkensis TaxID=1437816 RepID=A0A9W6N5C8_9HYPH|nr:hypothetical protein GCM10008174_08150 [Methylopila turkensis]